GGADAEEWWRGVTELASAFDNALDKAGRDPGDVRRYLYADAGPAYSLTSVAAFRETAERTKELGFTDLVVHWPRPEPPFAGDPAVLDELAGGVLDEVRADWFAGPRDGRRRRGAPPTVRRASQRGAVLTRLPDHRRRTRGWFAFR